MSPTKKKPMTCVKCKLHGQKERYANRHIRWCPFKECHCESCVEHEKSLDIKSKEKLKIKEMENKRPVEKVLPRDRVKLGRHQMERTRKGRGGIAGDNNNFSSTNGAAATRNNNKAAAYTIDLSSDTEEDINYGEEPYGLNLTDDDLPDPEDCLSKYTQPSTSKIAPIFSNYPNFLDNVDSPPRTATLPSKHTATPLGSLPTSTPIRKITASTSRGGDWSLLPVWTPLPSPPQVSSDSSPITPTLNKKTGQIQPTKDLTTLISESETEEVSMTSVKAKSKSDVQGVDQSADLTHSIKHCGIKEIMPQSKTVIHIFSDSSSTEDDSSTEEDPSEEEVGKKIKEQTIHETFEEVPGYSTSINQASVKYNTNEDHIEDEEGSLCRQEDDDAIEMSDNIQADVYRSRDNCEYQLTSEVSLKRPSRWDVPPPGWSHGQFLSPPPPVFHLAKISIPHRQVGLLLGREGHFIKKIRMQSEAAVSLGPPGYCTVEGSGSGVDQACRMIADRLCNR